MSHPNSYAGYIEIAAAQQLFNININVVVSTAALSPVTNLPLSNALLPCSLSPTCNALLHSSPHLIKLFNFQMFIFIYIFAVIFFTYEIPSTSTYNSYVAIFVHTSSVP